MIESASCRCRWARRAAAGEAERRRVWMDQPFDAGRHLRPSWQLPRANEVVVGCNIRRHAHVGEALEHDQRVVRTAAQRLSACEQKHQRRIVRRAGLDRSPRQIVKRFIVAAGGRRERQQAAVMPLRAAEVASRLELGRRSSRPQPARARAALRRPRWRSVLL